jgi:hypothetical protein
MKTVAYVLIVLTVVFFVLNLIIKNYAGAILMAIIFGLNLQTLNSIKQREL